MPPIDHLPLEILSAIFLHVLPPFDALKNPEYVPIVLSQVCRVWRTITLTLPGIWASLNITCNHDILHPPLHIIHTHLQRSATHPLSIILNTRVDNPLSNSLVLFSPHFPAILAALVAMRNRWRYISITLVSEARQETLDAITQGDAPLLQSFDCIIEKYPLRWIPSIPFHELQGWSQLESLTWSSINMHRQRLMLGDSAWPRLTALSLEVSLSSSECLTLLQLSPRLSTAMFHRLDRPDDDISPCHLIHAALQILRADGMYITTLIDALTLPALMDLRLRFYISFPPSTSHTILHPFLVRSAPPLRTLSLTNLNAPEPVLLRTLALAGGLHTLILTEFASNYVLPIATLIRALHPPPPPGPLPLCPCLRTLHIDAAGTVDAPDGVCAAMLRARWGMEAHDNGVASLSTARITLDGDGHKRDRAEMRVLDAEGMKVTF